MCARNRASKHDVICASTTTVACPGDCQLLPFPINSSKIALYRLESRASTQSHCRLSLTVGSGLVRLRRVHREKASRSKCAALAGIGRSKSAAPAGVGRRAVTAPGAGHRVFRLSSICFSLLRFWLGNCYLLFFCDDSIAGLALMVLSVVVYMLLSTQSVLRHSPPTLASQLQSYHAPDACTNCKPRDKLAAIGSCRNEPDVKELSLHMWSGTAHAAAASFMRALCRPVQQSRWLRIAAIGHRHLKLRRIPEQCPAATPITPRQCQSPAATPIT